MIFIEHAQIMIPALSGLAVTVWSGGSQSLKEFEKRFCFLPEIQTLYTEKGLLSFFEKKDGSHIYTVSDALDTQIIMIKIDEQWVILGPYVTSVWHETSAKVLLASCGVGDTFLLPYKLYRCGLPVLEQGFAVRTAALLLTHTVGNTPFHELETIHLTTKDAFAAQTHIAESYDAVELIIQRYALESQIVEAVRQGKTDEAVQRVCEMQLSVSGLPFYSDDMKDQIAGAAILRTLVRHAALRAGLTPVMIDSLSQKYAQKMHCAVDKQQMQGLIEQYIAAVCFAIRANNKNNYSVYVKRAVQYIETHLSQSISIDTLCKLNGISRKHFVHLFNKETGKTIKQYIMQVRCERAAELLENSQLLVHEISCYVGYEDNNYFTKVFKSVMGVSPQEYRKRKTFINNI